MITYILILYIMMIISVASLLWSKGIARGDNSDSKSQQHHQCELLPRATKVMQSTRLKKTDLLTNQRKRLLHRIHHCLPSPLHFHQRGLHPTKRLIKVILQWKKRVLSHFQKTQTRNSHMQELLPCNKELPNDQLRHKVSSQRNHLDLDPLVNKFKILLSQLCRRSEEYRP